MAMQALPEPVTVLFLMIPASEERWSMMPCSLLSYTTLFWMDTSLHLFEAMMPWLPEGAGADEREKNKTRGNGGEGTQ